MSLADEVIALQFGSPKLEELREAAKRGEPDALKRYVYYSAWQGIKADKYIPDKKKRAVFRELVDADLIEVGLG